MPKVADVKLFWTRSPSADIGRAVVEVTNNGTVTTTEVGPEVQELMVVVQPQSSVQFKVTVFDTEGLFATSEVYTFQLGDLAAPLPASLLGHEVVAIRDVT